MLPYTLCFQSAAAMTSMVLSPPAQIRRSATPGRDSCSASESVAHIAEVKSPSQRAGSSQAARTVSMELSKSSHARSCSSASPRGITFPVAGSHLLSNEYSAWSSIRSNWFATPAGWSVPVNTCTPCLLTWRLPCANSGAFAK